MTNITQISEKLNSYIKAYGKDLQSMEGIDRFMDVVSALARSNMRENQEHFTCGICHGIMIDPITLSCGHSFMKSCIVFRENTQMWDCPKCKRPYSQNYILQLKHSVVILALIEKWWGQQVKGSKLSYEGNQLLQNGNTLEALEKFNLALEIDPSNHLTAFSRSCALLSIGQTHAALNDAEAILKLCPTWSKGYFQRGTALVNLKRYEDAVMNFLHCYILDQGAVEAKNEAKSLICKIFISSSVVDCSLLHQDSFVAANMLQMKQLTGCNSSSLCSTDNKENTYATVGIVGESNVSDDDDELMIPLTEKKGALRDETRLHQLLCNVVTEVHQNNRGQTIMHKEIVPSLVDAADFECPLCMRLLLEPRTTPCGHTFCRTCLDRWFDHQPTCPLCKTLLKNFLAERSHRVTEFIEYAIKTLLPNDYAERKKIYDEEMAEFANAGKDLEHFVPLFICTVAYPTVPCPLHVFEPRYRLMMRQCMESGIRQFGMCAYLNDDSENISAIGTMLEIQNVQYFHDGRSVVDTVGRRRFRVLKKGMRDGYYTGAVEFLCDQQMTDEERQETAVMHRKTRKIADAWFVNLSRKTQETILSYFGSMPSVEDNYLSSSDGPSWLWWMLAVLPIELKVQLRVLEMTSLYQRLDTMRKILLHFCENSAVNVL